MKSGLKPTRLDHRDRDFHRSYRFGSVGAPTLPVEFDTDPKLSMPDQETFNNQFSPPIPALPFGCTDYTQNELCQDQDGRLYNASFTESKTHANALGGLDIRVSLSSIKKDGVQDADGKVGYNRSGYYNIRSYGLLDMFDAIRVAMFSSLPEKRAVSVGTPFYSAWSRPTNGILPMPPSFDTTNASWHNWKISGWKTIDGVPYLIGKTWQGAEYGDSGLCYMSRDLCNAVFSIKGCAAFTVTKIPPQQILPVDLNVVQIIVSFIRNLLKL